MVGEHLLPHESGSGHAQKQAGSKAALEHRGITAESDVTHSRTHHNVMVEELGTDSKEKFQDSRKDLPSGGPVGPASLFQSAPIPANVLVMSVNSSQLVHRILPFYHNRMSRISRSIFMT